MLTFIFVCRQPAREKALPASRARLSHVFLGGRLLPPFPRKFSLSPPPKPHAWWWLDSTWTHHLLALFLVIFRGDPAGGGANWRDSLTLNWGFMPLEGGKLSQGAQDSNSAQIWCLDWLGTSIVHQVLLPTARHYIYAS